MKCEVEYIHEDRVRRVEERMIGEEDVSDVSEIFKALGDPTRMKIMHSLSIEELCVCDLAKLINMSVSAVSHHLRILRNLRLVKHKKEGKMVLYSLDDHHITDLISSCIEHVQEER